MTLLIKSYPNKNDRVKVSWIFENGVVLHKQPTIKQLKEQIADYNPNLTGIGLSCLN